MSSSPQAGGQPKKGPYPSPFTTTGLVPSIKVDVPISAVFLALFIVSAATNMTIFQINKRRSHKFLFSGLLFGFSMARITTLVMRIVWANYPRNANIALAANIFVAAGVLLLFLLNLIFAQRIVRSYHPRFGWNRAVGAAWKAVYFSVLALLIMVIITNVHSSFTLDVPTKMRERDVLRFAVVYLAVLAFLPIPIVVAAVLWPRPAGQKLDKFGQGRMRTKVRLLLFTSALLSLGAWFRAATTFVPRLASEPVAWYHSRPAFYCFNFVVELLVVFTYVVSRFDKRFHVPDGSDGPGSYGKGGIAGAVNDEEEVFGSAEEGKEHHHDRDQSYESGSVGKDRTVSPV